jgi:hypothetical protein
VFFKRTSGSGAWAELVLEDAESRKTAGKKAAAGVCLGEQLVSSFSPPAFSASLQTSIFQARNRTTGAAVSNISQSDVKSHLSLRFPVKIHLCEPLSQPNAMGFSVAEPETMNANRLNFAEDFIAEHSFMGTVVTPAGQVSNSIRSQAASMSKSAQA